MPRGRRVVLILAALCGGAVVLAILVAPDARLTAVAGTPMVVRVDRDVTDREVAMAAAGARAADRWLSAAFGRTVEHRTRIRLTRRTACDHPYHRRSVAWARAGLVCVRAGRPAWRRLAAGSGLPAMDVVAHEVVHVAQSEMGCTEEPGAHRFLWLTEGTAVYGAREAMVMAGHSGAADTRRWIRAHGGDLPAHPALSTFERRAGDPAPYQLWHRAVRELARRSGERSLGRFCATVGRGTPWRAAFSGSFGLSVDRFYAHFERRRLGG